MTKQQQEALQILDSVLIRHEGATGHWDEINAEVAKNGFSRQSGVIATAALKEARTMSNESRKKGRRPITVSEWNQAIHSIIFGKLN